MLDQVVILLGEIRSLVQEMKSRFLKISSVLAYRLGIVSEINIVLHQVTG